MMAPCNGCYHNLKKAEYDLANDETSRQVVDRISQKAGENDHLFGSVTSKDIADVLAVKGYTIDRRKVELADPIKQLGEYKVSIRLHKDVTVQVPVIVTKEE